MIILKKEELRVIPTKNYIILGLVLLVSFLFIYYLYMWLDAYNESKLNKPILDRYMEVINYNELDNYLVESPNAIIYVSVLENSEIRDFEKQFKTILKNHQIEKDLLYMNITEEIKDNTLKKEMNSKYVLNDTKISDVPVIMVIDNGVLISMYKIDVNNYDMLSIKMFLNNIKFSTEDELDG